MRNVPLPLIADNDSGTMSIPLSKGLCTVIDLADADRIIPYPWHASRSANAYYARASLRGPLEGIQMHRLIIDAPNGFQVDHINGDTLDNRRSNLRIVDGARNMASWAKRHFTSKTSNFTGVSKSGDRWVVQIYYDGRQHYLGSFQDEIRAAHAYDDACEEVRGYRLNFPD